MSEYNKNTDTRQVSALIKEGNFVQGIQLSDGEIINREDGLALAKAGKLKGVSVGTRENGQIYLKNETDDGAHNSLNDLQVISNELPQRDTSNLK